MLFVHRGQTQNGARQRAATLTGEGAVGDGGGLRRLLHAYGAGWWSPELLRIMTVAQRLVHQPPFDGGG